MMEALVATMMLVGFLLGAIFLVLLCFMVFLQWRTLNILMRIESSLNQPSASITAPCTKLENHEPSPPNQQKPAEA